MFGGYVGYVGDGTTASSVGAEVEKAEDLGPVGSNPADAEDVPGTTVEAEPDAPVADRPSSPTGETPRSATTCATPSPSRAAPV